MRAVTTTQNPQEYIVRDIIRTKWAAVGAAVAVSLGAGGVSLTQAAISTGEKPVFVTLDAPCRVVDTRPAAGPIGPKGTPIAAGAANAYEIQITGANGQCTGPLAIPGDAVAVAANVTAIAPQSPTGRSFFTVYPGDAALSNTSNVNFLSGQAPVPNKVDVALSASGTIKIANDAGTAHVAVDIFGYYVDHNHDDRYHTKAQVDGALNTKADADDVYTRAEVDSALGDKADADDVYSRAYVSTRTQIDSALDDTPSRLNTLVVSPTNFRAVNPDLQVVAGNIYGAYVTGGSDTPVIRAPLMLPVGSTITGITYYYRDDNATADLSLGLTGTSLFTASQSSVGVFAATTSGSLSTVRTAIISGTSYVVRADTELALAAYSPTWPSAGGSLSIKGVVVQYVLP